MFETIIKFFKFCNEENRRKFTGSIFVGIINSLFMALRIGAVAVMLGGVIASVKDGIPFEAKTIWLSFAIMCVSVIGGIITRKITSMWQTEGGYRTCAQKRIEIAEHLRYLPMGYFNDNSLGEITSVTTNTMEAVGDVATRAIMMVFQGLLDTSLIIVMLFFFDWRIALVALAGFALFEFVNLFMRLAVKKVSAQKIKDDAAEIGKILEYIQGIAEVKAYNLAGKRSRELNDVINRRKKTLIKMEMRCIPVSNIQSLVAKLSGVAMMVASIYFFLSGTMTLANCSTMLVCSFMLFNALEAGGNYSALLRTIDIGVTKASAILALPTMDIEGNDNKCHPELAKCHPELVSGSHLKEMLNQVQHDGNVIQHDENVIQHDENVIQHDGNVIQHDNNSFIQADAIDFSYSSDSATAKCHPELVSGSHLKEMLNQVQHDGNVIQHDNNSFIQADAIDFSYSSDSATAKKIIDGISLSIPEHSTTAIVGPSGGGKTTFCHLLSRFWDVDKGSVTLRGKDVRDYSMDDLMKNFSFVFQNVYLFHDTIANNIRFGEPNAPMEKVIEAAKKACCHDFISALPNGYDTVIGEGGASLSGGERQRISIARAIMKDSPIIILDEATANVDPENERDLMAAISELTKEKTVIMIAHRLKTVRNADQIVVIDKGRIAEQGKHDELVKLGGIYARFIDSRKEAVSWKL